MQRLGKDTNFFIFYLTVFLLLDRIPA